MSEYTEGPWEWWTSNSWKRLKYNVDGTTKNVLEPYVCSDGHPDLNITKHDMALIKAAPDLLALVKQLMDEFRPDPAYDEFYYPSWALADAIVKDIESD